MKDLNKTTELVFILDKSGSMAGLESDTIGGFNSLIAEQKRDLKDNEKVYVSTVLFNHESKVIHDRVDLEKIGKMTERDYVVGGSTALIDALGDAIRHIRNIHKYIRKEDVPSRTIFVITTDGQENSSRRYSSDDVKKLIGAQKRNGWEFIFLGANIDSVETAKRYGISEDTAVNYKADSQGTHILYEAVSRCVSHARKSAPGLAMGSSWRESIDEDYKKRK